MVMRRSILRALYLTAAIFAVPARALAVWPPSTAFEAEAAASTASRAQAATDKLEQDKRRLEEVIQDLKLDEAALKKLSQEGAVALQ